MRKILIVGLTIISVSSLYADGIKLMGGLNLSKYAASTKGESQGWGYKAGFCVGAGFEFDLFESRKIAIEIDALYVQKKGSRGEAPNAPNVERTYSLNTLRFPVLARFQFKKGIPLYLLGGSEFSLVMSHKQERKSENQKSQIDFKESTKNADFGVVLGIGFEIKIREFQTVFIEGRYHFGLVNIVQEIEDLESLKTHAFLIVFGIKSF